MKWSIDSIWLQWSHFGDVGIFSDLGHLILSLNRYLFSSICSVISLIIIPVWCVFSFALLIRVWILLLNFWWHFEIHLFLFDIFCHWFFHSYVIYLWIWVRVTGYGVFWMWSLLYVICLVWLRTNLSMILFPGIFVWDFTFFR